MTSSPRDMRELDLDSLAVRAAAGDPQAESTLFAELRERIAAIAKRRVREDEVDDCVQETLAIVHARYRARSGGARILPWSLAVMRNVIGNVYQRRKREKRNETLPADGAVEVAGRSEDPLDDLAGVELRSRVVQALRILERDHPRCGRIFRAILAGLARGDAPEAVVVEALTVAREADSRLTRGNFHVILHRCRGRLKRVMEGAGS